MSNHNKGNFHDAEEFKNKSMKRIRQRKIFEKTLFAILCFLAITIMLIAIWMYTAE